jgi:putative SOS response-associated peptidase YedK
MLEFRSLSKMLDRLRWDLVPYWAKDEKSPSKQSLHGLRRSKIAKKKAVPHLRKRFLRVE